MPAPLQAVGGNAALALLLTVGTNLAGIFTMPFMLSAILGMGSSAVTLDPGPLLGSLLRTIAAPLLAGIAARALLPGARLLHSTLSCHAARNTPRPPTASGSVVTLSPIFHHAAAVKDICALWAPGKGELACRGLRPVTTSGKLS